MKENDGKIQKNEKGELKEEAMKENRRGNERVREA